MSNKHEEMISIMAAIENILDDFRLHNGEEFYDKNFQQMVECHEVMLLLQIGLVETSVIRYPEIIKR